MKQKELLSLEVGASPDKAEIATANLLVVTFGEPIKFLKEANIQGQRTPDIFWRERNWEIKNPVENGKRTIENAIQHASKQSSNIIIDLRQCKMQEQKAISKCEREFSYRTSIKRLLLIKKSQETFELSRK